MPRALSVSLTAIAASTCLGLAAGCNGASPLAPAGDPIASPVAPQTHSGAANLGTPLAAGPGLAEAPLALYRLSLDPATLQGSFTPLAARGLQQTDDVFDLSVDNFLQAGSLTISRITANPRTVDITYRFTHPFRAPSDPTAPATAANRADLGIAGRVLFLADVTPGPDNTFFAGADPVILNSRLVTNADGYFAPKALLGLSGFGANTFPYKMLGDETYDPDTGFREGVSNGGDVTGNYDPMVGWQRDTLGPDNAGWTGYGVLHQGQVALNTISVSQEALREGERFDVDVAVLAKYADPRGGATGIEKRANRLPADPPDVSKFVYRMPHGALDVQRVTFLREDGTLLTNSNSTTRVRFHVEDWDARATETAEDDLANEPMASKVAKLESGVPTLEVSAPGIIGDASAVTIFDPATTLINDDSGFGGDAAADTGVPSDALFYRGTLTNTVTTGQVRGTSIAVVR
ncbi:MAG TPA: hypothetical protein VEI97_16480, partial [bacterium]|nr:hypothetical protein [bacterium]